MHVRNKNKVQREEKRNSLLPEIAEIDFYDKEFCTDDKSDYHNISDYYTFLQSYCVSCAVVCTMKQKQ